MNPERFPVSLLKTSILSLSLLLPLVDALAQPSHVRVLDDAEGARLQVNGEDFLVQGMNWDYFPIGTNYSYSLWNQDDDFIRTALDREMAMLKGMGVNTIRQYTGVPARWVQYMYERWGIYTVINYPFGRYGLTIDGAWVPSTDYANPRTREILLAETQSMIDEYAGTPGLLVYLLGNENNYGLFWSSAETEDMPQEQKNLLRARYMYSAFGEAVELIKSQDGEHPVAMANGDLQYIDMIKVEVPELDILGTNMYRGISFGDAFQRVRDELGLPIMFTEFGCDAFNAIEMREDQFDQARYLLGQWEEIYLNAAGIGGARNAIGGLTFQFSDGWWKYKQDAYLDVHDTNASWANGGYPHDLAPGENNMNEEWWGLCAKGPTQNSGLYDLYPRAAYYALADVNLLNPYSAGVDAAEIRAHFDGISAMKAVAQARGDQAALVAEQSQKFRVSGLRVELESIITGGERITTPETRTDDEDGYPRFQGFDHMESFYMDVAAQPAGNVNASMTLNVLGNVPTNSIDEIFYENRDRAVEVSTPDGPPTEISGMDRVRVHHADVSWQHPWFNLTGFYRSGHYHWGYEGDFFGLYREANYGENIDMYNGNAPVGMELEMRRQLSGLKVAMGPELWWGANPAVLAKYQRSFGRYTAAVLYQEDLDDQTNAVSSSAIPEPVTRKATFHIETKRGPLGLEAGGIWAGYNKVDDTFQYMEDGVVMQDYIRASDTFGGKARVTWSSGRWNWYAQGAMMGLVADGGPTAIQTFTGWRLADCGSGNQMNALTGFTYMMGDLQIAPNFLWQKPIVGPMPADAPAPGRLRNVLDDPFAVRANRETTAGELLLTWDPTPGTWMYAWNADEMEDAPFACNLGFIYRHYATDMDGGLFFLDDGVTTAAFDTSTPARNLWEVHSRLLSKNTPSRGIIADLYVGTGEPNGDDQRVIHRYGADARLLWNAWKLVLTGKVNDWGPYDYHKDFNMTYPLQLAVDLSTTLSRPTWWDLPSSRLGIKLTWRTLDEYSNRYEPLPGLTKDSDESLDGYDLGREWEIRTYLHIGI